MRTELDRTILNLLLAAVQGGWHLLVSYGSRLQERKQLAPEKLAQRLKKLRTLEQRFSEAVKQRDWDSVNLELEDGDRDLIVSCLVQRLPALDEELASDGLSEVERVAVETRLARQLQLIKEFMTRPVELLIPDDALSIVANSPSVKGCMTLIGGNLNDEDCAIFGKSVVKSRADAKNDIASLVVEHAGDPDSHDHVHGKDSVDEVLEMRLGNPLAEETSYDIQLKLHEPHRAPPESADKQQAKSTGPIVDDSDKLAGLMKSLDNQKKAGKKPVVAQPQRPEDKCTPTAISSLQEELMNMISDAEVPERPVLPPEKEGFSKQPVLFNAKVIRNYRLRTQARLDLHDHVRAKKRKNLRLSMVHLQSLLELLILDHVLAKRKDLGVTIDKLGNLNMAKLILKILGDRMAERRCTVVTILSRSRMLLNPAYVLSHQPYVLTQSLVAEVEALIKWALGELEFKLLSPSLGPDTTGPTISAVWKSTQ